MPELLNKEQVIEAILNSAHYSISTEHKDYIIKRVNELAVFDADNRILDAPCKNEPSENMSIALVDVCEALRNIDSPLKVSRICKAANILLGDES